MKRPLLLACLVCLASCQRATVDENGARVVLECALCGFVL